MDISRNQLIFACAVVMGCGLASVVSLMSLSPLESSDVQKVFTLVSSFSVLTGIIATILCVYYFKYQPEFLNMFLLFFTMLVAVPVMVMSTSFSMITLANVRNVLAKVS
jgi:hypothetical protein